MAYRMSWECLVGDLRESALKVSKVLKELGNYCDDLAEIGHFVGIGIYEQLSICRAKMNFDLLSTQ